MVTFVFNIADVIKNQYLVYGIYNNHQTKVMAMSGSEIFGWIYTSLSYRHMLLVTD